MAKELLTIDHQRLVLERFKRSWTHHALISVSSATGLLPTRIIFPSASMRMRYGAGMDASNSSSSRSSSRTVAYDTGWIPNALAPYIISHQYPWTRRERRELTIFLDSSANLALEMIEVMGVSSALALLSSTP